MRVGAGDSETDWGVAQAEGARGPDDRMELGGDPGPQDSRPFTAAMEGFNRLFSAVKRKVPGYRTVEPYMTAMLYFVAGKLTLPCH